MLYWTLQAFLGGLKIAFVTPQNYCLCYRFALKQEKFENLGQWKHNNATNEEWRKLAYSWPAKEDGSLNEVVKLIIIAHIIKLVLYD